MENHFEAAFKSMPTPAFIIDSNSGEILDINTNFDLIFKNRNAQAANHWNALCHDTDQLNWAALQEKIQNKTLERCECNMRVGDKIISMQLSFQALQNTVLACVYDSEHLDLATAENTLLKFALHESSAGLWIWETGTDFIACSKSIALLLGCEQESTPRSSAEWHTRVHPDDVERLTQVVSEHISLQQDLYEVEYRIRKHNQDYMWVKERGRTYTHALDGSINKVIGFVVDISHQKALEEHLRNQATFDELTGLLTRAAAITHFKKQLGLARRQYTPLTMAKIFLDTNNKLAKLPLETRNIAILTAARHIYKKIREADILARVEADKLLLLLPNTSIKDAHHLLESILAPTEEETTLLAKSHVSVSDIHVGIAAFPEDGEDIEELAQSANHAVEQGLAEQQQIAIR
ncbi:sensor domain-containing diguanylate cyclase [Marinomonas epiphytica]